MSSRLGFSNRLWMPVSETDMSGLWLVERRARYLPLLAGPFRLLWQCYFFVRTDFY